MQEDFHYYAAYAAAILAGYSHEESLAICYSDQFTDCCSRTFLDKVHGPKAAATTQLQAEMMQARTDIIGRQDITRIWASFHFLPRDLNAPISRGSRQYRCKYRLICGPNGSLLTDTIKLAADSEAGREKSLQAVGIAMHILADTWAHQYFAGTPSLVINNTGSFFYEITGDGERQIRFGHNPTAGDDIEAAAYTNTLFRMEENSIMNLGHGRAGHLPDLSFMRYRYLPAWGDFEEVIKDNPAEYYQAFCQKVYAMQQLRRGAADFQPDTYAFDTVAPYREEIMEILTVRRLNASGGWKAFGEKLSGRSIPDFDVNLYSEEYLSAEETEKGDTFLGRYFSAALAQKGMVTHQIFRSGSLLAGFSIEGNRPDLQDLRELSGMKKGGAQDE